MGAANEKLAGPYTAVTPSLIGILDLGHQPEVEPIDAGNRRCGLPLQCIRCLIDDHLWRNFSDPDMALQDRVLV